MLLEQWQHNEPVSLFVSDGETEQEYRLWFKTMSAFDASKFQTKQRRARLVIEELYGTPDDRTPEQQEDAEAMSQVLYYHAAIFAALGKVELNSEDGWQAARLPESWYDAKTAAHEMPAEVINDLFVATIEAGNSAPTFGILPSTDGEKKALRLTVQPSKN